MKLHELKLPVKVYEECSDGSTYFTVHHLDGMYSYCKTENNTTIHLSVMTPLIKHNDGYKIGEEA